MSTITPERWREISPYLDHALSLSEAERAAWIDSLRTEHADTVALLEDLLKEHRELADEHFLEQSPVPPVAESSLAGQTVGAYKLISPIGQGGMGTVWLAERTDGRFDRRVAIKFLNFAVAQPGAERFAREGKILARLAHPHIAQMVDAGVSSSAQPYLVLEYCEGEHIDRYCDREKLDIDTRVRLFLDVLAAVAHAHSNLIVHRDIKPSNVIVAKNGDVKLLDFGIAKLLGDDGTPAATLLTLESAAGLTPQFAAPEQIAGGAITTGTDVYSLGVLLYILLTGRHPAGPGPHSPADLVKAITETVPPRASDAAALAGSEEDVAAVASSRSTNADKLRRQLRGDLDNIVAKALKKNPAERYSSVTAFADDLRRYLNHEPIKARPDTLGYRATKFVRRNRLAVGLSALALLAIIGGVTGTLLQARTARRQRDFALRELSHAEAVSGLDQFVLADAAPSGKSFTVDDLLRRAEQIARRQQGDPGARADLLISIGHQYTVQDEYQSARRLLEEGYRLSRGISNPSIRASADCGLGQVLSRTSDTGRAEELFREGLVELPNDPIYLPDRVECLLRGSEIARNNGRDADALARAQSAELLLRQSPLHSDSLDLDADIVLAGAFNYVGLRAEANGAYREAAHRLSILGRDNTQMAGTLDNNWATMLIRAGRPLDAEVLLRRTIQISRDNEGEDSVSPTTLSNYSLVLSQLHRLSEAADYADRAVAKAKSAGDTMATAQAILHRAQILRLQREFAESSAALARVAAILHPALPPGHIAFALIDSERALVADATGDGQTAMRLANEAENTAQAVAKRNPGAGDYIGLILLQRAQIDLDAGYSNQALTDASRALQILQKAAIPGSSSAGVGHAYLIMGRALQAQGKADQARAAFRSAAENLEGALGPGHPDSRAARALAGVSTP